MVKYLNTIILIITPAVIMAQSATDSTNNDVNRAIQAEFPSTRAFNLEYNRSFSRDFESHFQDEEFEEGSISRQKSINFTTNIPILKRKTWNLSATGNYNYYRFDFSDVENVSNYIHQSEHTPSETTEFHYYAASLNATAFSTLFKKPVIYSGRLIVDGGDDGLERLKGFLSAAIILKRNANTTITTGLMGFIDPAAQIPFSPLFSYNHKFKESPWELDVILPQRILFRRAITSKDRLSIGTTFNGDAFYVNSNSEYLPSTYSYSQLRIDGGIIYEYKLSEVVFATFKTGARKYISNRLTEKTLTTDEYIYSNDQETTFYFNIGVSFNPF